MSNVTVVTGLWNIKRDELGEGWSRTFQHYLDKFDQLLQIENNMIIFGEPELESFVFERRDRSNTQFITRDKEWFKQTVPYDKIQEIRNNPDWFGQAGWLQDSTQGFVAFPYDANNEIHGFSYPKINSYAGDEVKLVCRGGLFGGPKHVFSDINGIYYNILSETLRSGYMGTEESIFSIMLYKHSDMIDYVEIEGNGLISKFCEDLKNDTYEVKNISGKKSLNKDLNINNSALYVITFNSPKQFETLIESMIQYDRNFLDRPKKYLLDNSSDLETTERYIELCNEFGFEHIKKDNLGICGGRQFIAEHADENNFDFYFFFEDDMFFFPKKGEVCKNGFNRTVNNLYINSLEITKKEDLDFLKMNYTEFYGDNGTQWSWYNVPQHIREEFWPNKPNLPVMGLDPNAPKTNFNKILTYKGIPYALGDVYYCNWPQVVTKYGNQKMFLETKWARPFEQTWMSFIYQETKKGNINPGLLLLTPTEHDRFDFYDGSLRKES